MKATGIVRRIEECVITGQKSKKLHKYWFFRCFCLDSICTKTKIHSKKRGISPRFIFYFILFVLVRAALTDFKCLCISSNSFRVETPSFP